MARRRGASVREKESSFLLFFVFPSSLFSLKLIFLLFRKKNVFSLHSGHTDDVFDLSWAPDGSALASASLENTVLVWDTPLGGGAPSISAVVGGGGGAGGSAAAPPPSNSAAAAATTLLPPLPAAGNGGRPRARLDAHRHYVQGVAWDPTGATLASASADRSVKIYRAAAESVGRKKKRTLERRAAERAAAVAAAAAAGEPVPPPPPRPPLAASADRLACVATMQRRLAAAAEVPGALATAAAANAAAAVAAAAAAAAAAPGALAPPPPPPPPPLPRLPLFADESLPSFFRRLGWSPDGSCLGVPAGLIHPGGAAAAAAANAAAASAAAAAGAKGKAATFSAAMPPPPPPLLSSSTAAAAVAAAAATAAGAGPPAAIPAAPQHAAFLYARGEWGAPAAALPSVKPTVAVRFCPVLFALEGEEKREGEKREEEGDAATCAPSPSAGAAASSSQQQQQQPPLFDLPYRLVFAVASLDSVAVYETGSLKPLALLGALHPEPVTDVAWSCCGRFLAVSSYDGYCSVAAFAPGELGTPLAASAAGVPDFVRARVASQAKALSGALPAAAVPATPAAAAKVPAPPRQEAGGAAGPRRLVPEPVAAAAAPGPRRIAPTPLSAVPGSLADAAGPPPPPPRPQQPAGGDTRRRIAPQPVGEENAAPVAITKVAEAAAAAGADAPAA